MEKPGKISTGSFDLNKWLYGGYEKDVITMIAGPPGSGKTNFAILASCSQAKHGNKVIFIDTEGGFSIDRVKQITGENYEGILKNILLLTPTSFSEQKKSFETLLNHLKRQKAEPLASSSKSQTKEQVGLIVVDSMAMLYRLELGEALNSEDGFNIKEVNREVAKQMRILAEISRRKNIPIIITNQVYESFVPEEQWKKGIKGETNIVGGDLFQYWSKCIIELQNTSGRKKAILRKHRSLQEKELNFEIHNKGIFRRGWI
ncbi:MAG TPA: DNA repair and recombination protein RadB [Candidatus Nanoarchaeia archaeon]|nr:DNA repair and recombination protein RadB [Candidatus Nanoarchaeia archaeon]